MGQSRYGVPYQGSKNAIAEKIVDALPGGKVLVDLFAGGCAITHAALLSRKWERVICNDICDAPALFLAAARGELADERRWISREDFFRLKDTEPYVRYCWSFGNNATDYLYSREIEPWKRALWHARVLGDRSLLEEMGIHGTGTRADVLGHTEEYKDKYTRWWLARQQYSRDERVKLIARCRGEIAKSGEELRQYLLRGLASSGLSQAEVGKRLGTQMQGHYFGRSQWGFPTEEHYNKMRAFMPALDKDYNEVVGLHRLWQSLESLQSLASLESLQQDYREVELPAGAVVYCDIPYNGTAGYNGTEFDHKAFYHWACETSRRGWPVFVSEYSMPEGWECVARWNKRGLFSAAGNNAVVEKLFVPPGQQERGRVQLALDL